MPRATTLWQVVNRSVHRPSNHIAQRVFLGRSQTLMRLQPRPQLLHSGMNERAARHRIKPQARFPDKASAQAMYSKSAEWTCDLIFQQAHTAWRLRLQRRSAIVRQQFDSGGLIDERLPGLAGIDA